MSSRLDFVIRKGVLESYKGPGGHVEIPESVIIIGNSAFKKCEYITSLVIPNSVKTIEKLAFYGCKNLETVEIPDSVETIGAYAFDGCEKLADEAGFIIKRGILLNYMGEGGEVSIPKGVTRIGSGAFDQCDKLTGVTIHSGVCEIGSYAFYSCKNLERVTMAEGVTAIEYCAFLACEKLESIVIPESMKSIGWQAFEQKGAFKIPSYLKMVKVPVHCGMNISSCLSYRDDLRIDIEDPSALAASLRPCAALCFAEGSCLPTDPRFKSYAKYFKSSSGKLVKQAAGSTPLLTLLCREKWIKAKDVEAFVEAIQENGDPERIAMILDYQTNKLTAEQKEKVVKQKEQQDNTVFMRAVTRANQEGISGLNFVVTGDMVTFADRDALKAYIQKHGGHLQSAISASTDYLIINDADSATTKKRKALELGIEMITEQQFNEKANRQFSIDDYGRLIRYLGKEERVVIPDSVKTIGEGAFRGCGNITTVTIADSVTTIYEAAFCGCDKLTEVILGSGVTFIGRSAFENCCNLEIIEIPDSVVQVDVGAFKNCKKLMDSGCFFIQRGILRHYDGNGGSVVIPDHVHEIGTNAFYGCGNLTEITIGNNVRTIGDNAFSRCKKLHAITIPDSVTAVGKCAFQECGKLTTAVIGSGVTAIGPATFLYCARLETLTMGSGITEVGEYAFDGCDKLIICGKTGSFAETYAKDHAILFLAEGQSKDTLNRKKEFIIHFGALREYKGSGTDVVIPKGVTKIERWAFSRGQSIKSITIPDNVRTIEKDAFKDCTKLTSLTFGSGLSSMENPFGQNISLKKVTMPVCVGALVSKHLNYTAALRIDIPDLTVLASKLKICAVLCFAEDGGLTTDPRYESHGNYIQANAGKMAKAAAENPALLALLCREGWIKTKNIPEFIAAVQQTGNADVIAMMQDYQDSRLTDQEKEKAKKQKEKLEKAAAERSAARKNRIGISGLKFVLSGYLLTFTDRAELKEYLEEQGAKLQPSMTAKTDYLIMNNGKPDMAKKQKAMELGIEVITEYMFNDLAGRQFVMGVNGRLTRYVGSGGDVIIPENVKEIGNDAFQHNKSLISVTVSGSVKAIGESAFFDCTELKTVTLSDGLKTIGGRAFSACTSMTAVKIPDSITGIGRAAFLSCKSLQSVTIPGSVSTISEAAFGRCTNLADVIIEPGVTAIGKTAFRECKALSSVKIPDSVTAIGESAFRDCPNLTIHAPADSYAESYARENNIPFVAE